LLNEKFQVESYQRGYRWGDIEVNALLNDIFTFSQNEGKDPLATYWLQPVIVTKVTKDIDNNPTPLYELVDGQQRLTTIYLICSYLKNVAPFSIFYNTRTGSQTFLTKLNTLQNIQSWTQYISINQQEDKIDNFHFFNSYKIIQKWFDSASEEKKGGKSNLEKEDFLRCLLEQTKVIWYELKTNSDPKTIFEQINIGKIPLTNAELIKALYLNNAGNKTRKNEIAEKWDRIEYALNDVSFWSFINQNIERSHNRIEYILDLISGKYDSEFNEEEKLHTFFHFLNNENKDKEWKKAERYFHVLMSWYEDSELYHYVGYLIYTGFSKINELIKLYDSKLNSPKSEFKTDIIALIKEKVGKYQLELLSFDKQKDYEKIKNVLLLFNVETTLKSTPYNYFPFYKYKYNQWSLEHIHA
jgi:uncharacterized protein with ParB-like and HNH nuclease domain